MRNLIQLIRYSAVSVGSYLFVFSMMYVLVDCFKVPKNAAFVTVYGVAYVAEYFINLKYLFKTYHSWGAVAKYIGHLLFFISFGSMVFQWMLGWHIHYLIAVLLTAAALFPLRFLSYKFIVFK